MSIRLIPALVVKEVTKPGRAKFEKMVLSLVLLALTSLTLTGGSESRDLPDFPDYFTAGVEDIVELNGMVSQNVSRVS